MKRLIIHLKFVKKQLRKVKDEHGKFYNKEFLYNTISKKVTGHDVDGQIRAILSEYDNNVKSYQISFLK